MVARYKNKANIELAITIEVDDDVRKRDESNSISTNNSCKVVYD